MQMFIAVLLVRAPLGLIDMVNSNRRIDKMFYRHMMGYYTATERNKLLIVMTMEEFQNNYIVKCQTKEYI